MGEKLGWLGEKLAFGCGALFSWIVVVQGALTACRGGGWALFTLAGLGGMGALVLLGVRYLKPARAFSLGLFTLRLAIALGVVFLFGAQPVQDFKTMYDAACQLARGSREYLQSGLLLQLGLPDGLCGLRGLGGAPVRRGPAALAGAQRRVDGGHRLPGVRHRPAVLAGDRGHGGLPAVRAVPGALLPGRRADQPAHRRVFLLPGLLAAGPAGEALPRRGGAGGAVPGGGQRHAPPGGGDSAGAGVLGLGAPAALEGPRRAEGGARPCWRRGWPTSSPPSCSTGWCGSPA